MGATKQLLSFTGPNQAHPLTASPLSGSLTASAATDGKVPFFAQKQTGSHSRASTARAFRRRCIAAWPRLIDRESAVGREHAHPARSRRLDAAMVQRWAAASFLATKKNFRRIMGWKDRKISGNWRRSYEENQVSKQRSSRRPRKMNRSTAPKLNYNRDTVQPLVLGPLFHQSTYR